DDRHPERGVQHRDGLVRHEERGARDEGPGDRHPLQLPAGQLVGIPAANVPEPHPHGVEGVIDARLPFGPCGHAEVPGGGAQVGVHGAERVERRVRILEHRLHLAPEPRAALGPAEQGHVPALEEDAAGAGRGEAQDHARQRRLAAPALSGQRQADAKTLFERPLHPYTKHLIQSLPRVDDKARRVSIPGQPPALDAPPPGCRFHPRCPHAMAVCRVEQPPMETVGPDHRVACFLVSGGGGDGG
ncbi:MAG: hypothetical protein E6J41_15200, partial [Chloroflexi bacterium]